MPWQPSPLEALPQNGVLFASFGPPYCSWPGMANPGSDGTGYTPAIEGRRVHIQIAQHGFAAAGAASATFETLPHVLYEER